MEAQSGFTEAKIGSLETQIGCLGAENGCLVFRECCFYNAFLKRALLGMMRMFEFQLAISLFSFFPSFVFVYIEDSLFVQRDLYTN